VHVLLHGLASFGVLEAKGGKFANGRAAQEQLTGRGPDDVRAGLRLYDQITWSLWTNLEQTVRSGQPARLAKPSADFARIFSEGVEAFTRPAAAALTRAYDFSPHRRILDLAGGTGSYLLPILGQHASISATLYELPQAADAARRRLSADPLGARVEIVEGDALFDPIPGGHDVVLLANTIHLFAPDKVKLLFRRTRDAVAPGARLVIPEYWVDSTHTRPFLGAMLAGTFLLLAGDGTTYSPEEARVWLEATGWRMLAHRPLLGAITVVVAEAV